MNATASNVDYNAQLQHAAHAFMQRHQGEHLNDQQLFDRAVAYLVATYGITQAQAENAAGRVELGPDPLTAFDSLPSADAIVQSAMEFMQRLDRQSAGTVLCSTTAQFLAGKHDIPQSQAEDAAALAFGRLNPSPIYLDITRSDSQTLMLRDPASQVCYVVPVAYVVHHIIRNPARRSLHVVH